MIPVYRPEEEVFAPECIASFEGMPVTNDHPTDGVTVENARALQRGHAHNVRRGSGEESDLLLADLIITDPGLIEAILHGGKREISCGYTYELCEENGQFIQRKIRGNHVAVVDAGRAGARVSIKDHLCKGRGFFMKKSLYRKLCRMARDGDPEAAAALAEIVEELALPGEEAAPEPVVVEEEKEPEVIIETEEGNTIAVDEADIAGILERLDRLIELMTPGAGGAVAPGTDEDPEEEIAEAVEEMVEAVVGEGTEGGEMAKPEVPDAEEIAEMVEEIIEAGPVSTVLTPEEETDEECEERRENEDKALKAVIQGLRPTLRSMTKKQRRQISRDIAACYYGKDTKGISPYAALAAARDSKAARRDANGAELGKRIMAKRNPNYKE